MLETQYATAAQQTVSPGSIEVVMIDSKNPEIGLTQHVIHRNAASWNKLTQDDGPLVLRTLSHAVENIGPPAEMLLPRLVLLDSPPSSMRSIGIFEKLRQLEAANVRPMLVVTPWADGVKIMKDLMPALTIEVTTHAVFEEMIRAMRVLSFFLLLRELHIH